MTKVLIANRGEIAVRIIRACHEEGLEAVAVYSDADRLAAHVRAADHAIRLGPAAPAESYLRIDRIIEAAGAAGATLVHPGYGFLAERAAFADAVAGAGLTFVGPPADAIRAMGDKTSARDRMAAAGVPIVPGAQVEAGKSAEASAAAATVGFPLVVKASAGGGGRGMRIVRTAAELAGALVSAASEAEKAFGDGRVYLERYVERGRHVEVQILADLDRVVHLGERECSIQRRYQKLVEESPSVAVTPDLRRALGAAAVAAARAVGYRSAGTIEFLLASDRSFYFLEMNTRIQVEHPVTELVYGVDLVREQLRIAAGEPMRVHTGWLNPRGWAIECRITSEDPANGFLPSTGRIEHLRIPGGPGVRWDGGVDVGDEVTLYYDSMLAKLIVWGPDRAQAIRRMQRALDELAVLGVATNQGFHRRLLADPAFQAGDIDIQFLERRPDLAQPRLSDGELLPLAVAAALAEDEARRGRRPVVGGDDRGSDAWTQRARHEALR
ncbi:MAG: acetyl-CoA carboxylase biotin carboxylase subunit [Gemmatimonadales bacterium]